LRVVMTFNLLSAVGGGIAVVVTIAFLRRPLKVLGDAVSFVRCAWGETRRTLPPPARPPSEGA
jgi:hypothetical protein